MKICLIVLTLFTLFARGVVGSPSPEIRKEIVIDAPRDALWKAWTTVEGVRSFFARDAVIDLRVGGEYSILFFPEAEPGQRGAEGMRILAIDSPNALVFEWNAPPSLPEVRDERTRVTVRLEPVDTGRTRLELIHDQWKTGGQWDQAYEYFIKAWDVVLNRLDKRFSEGPIDWSAMPGQSRSGS